VKWFLVLFILACSAGTVSVAQPSSAPFIDVVNTDGVAADLFARDFRADRSCSGLTLHIQPQGKPTQDSRAAFRVTFYEDKGWFLVEKRHGGFAGGLGVKRHHAVQARKSIDILDI
jgi:hypothetical protein